MHVQIKEGIKGVKTFCTFLPGESLVFGVRWTPTQTAKDGGDRRPGGGRISHVVGVELRCARATQYKAKLGLNKPSSE